MAAGWSQEHLALLLTEASDRRWLQSTVHKSETGGRPLTLPDLEALADVFGLNLDDLLYGDREHESDRYADAPRPDPLYDMRHRKLTGRRDALSDQVQTLVLLLDRARAELAEVEAELREPYGVDITTLEPDYDQHEEQD